WSYACGMPSDDHEVGFLRGQRLVGLTGEAIGQLLDIVLRLALFVFADFLVFQQFLEVGQHVATHVANRYAGIFGFLPRLLDKALAGLFGQLRHRDTDDGTCGAGIESQVRLHNRLLDIGHHAALPRRYRERARVLDADIGNLTQRHIIAVIVDAYRIENARMRTTGAYLVEIMAERLDRLFHAFFGIFLQIVDQFNSPELALRPRRCRLKLNPHPAMSALNKGYLRSEEHTSEL